MGAGDLFPLLLLPLVCNWVLVLPSRKEQRMVLQPETKPGFPINRAILHAQEREGIR